MKCLISFDIITLVDTANVLVIMMLGSLNHKLGQRLQRKYVQIGFVVAFWVCTAMFVLSFVLVIAPSGADETDKKINLE